MNLKLTIYSSPSNSRVMNTTSPYTPPTPAEYEQIIEQMRMEIQSLSEENRSLHEQNAHLRKQRRNNNIEYATLANDLHDTVDQLNNYRDDYIELLDAYNGLLDLQDTLLRF